MNPLQNEIKYLKGVGEHRGRLLQKLGIKKIGDILEHFPRDYINRAKTDKICNLKFGENCAIVGKIIAVEKKNFGRRKSQLNIVISDGDDNLFCTWFRFGKWLSDKLETGQQIWVSGLVTQFRNSPQIIHPEIEILDDADETNDFWHSRKMLPVYPLTDGISANIMRKLIYNAFSIYSKNITETLPDYILQKYDFESRNNSLQKVHFSQNLKEIPKLKKRFAFEELFFTQLMLARCKKYHEKTKGNKFILQKTFTSKLKKSLPFELTNAQKRVLQEILDDMTSDQQMNRLLQGDVGSGKTIVTVFALLLALENGFQAVLMAPTEILAEQHFKSISAFLQNQRNIKIALLKGGNYKGKKLVKEQIQNGEIDIIIGTHALIQKDVNFKKVGIVAIDEQHRFGVEQRAILSQKNNAPDLMYLSATPIPRSLALTVYGDLDISILDELPPNRKSIKTVWRGASKKHIIYEEIRTELQNGHQIYIVCPLVEESEKMDLLDAETLFATISTKIFPEFKSAILHGRMKAAEKDEIMQNFKEKKIDVLVSTTVIEVGIDIPNATVMLIEHAERFGLSQLHQLRGRVGRGEEKSYCYLISYPPISNDGRERLNTMVATNDGFVIAEKDLEIRGPGNFFGTEQSGLPVFKHANIVRDRELLNQARILAFDIIAKDENLQLPENVILKEIYFQTYFKREKLFDY
ncbi:MAG: ATP-dependent DNA helicase RecG [Candidatus Cloacimonetes bacterium]|jgi:ATP-dependent DNA helicase RecG|nr:ATP-dependent DNA helicase RecG [Candidatus Cloacimonadota bacterium]MBT7468958.1 ATP-dependent DNA helicase RecG [Candidatus Cloacimonadota bacterium]